MKAILTWCLAALLIQPCRAQEAGRSHFEVVVLDSTVTNPMEIAIARDGRVFIAERGGALKVWDPAVDSTYTAGFFPSSATLNDGFLGLTLDPNFDENGWAYLHYAPLEGAPRNRVSRVTIEGNRVRPGSEKILLEWKTQREECCHAGGSVAFGPEGNLFPPGTPKTRPEIYVMGVRNAYRISVDPATGWLFWGDVGPGAVVPDEERGPAGFDEINVARAPGFYGWPYFNADNRPYRDVDFATGVVGAYFDPAAPINDSPNNTGLRELPPVQPPAIWYTKTDTTDFPTLGVGGATPIAGPRYRYDAESVHPSGLPERLDGKLIIGDWMRNWFMLVDLDAEGRAVDIEPFLEDVDLRPMDIELGLDGHLYVIDWGPRYIGYNLEARVVRLDYHDGRSNAQETARIDRTATRDHPPETALIERGEPSSSTDAAPRPDAAETALVIHPENGAIFDYNTPIPFEVDAPSDEVQVITSWLCDSHTHPLDTLSGSSGTIRVPRRPVEIGYTIKRDEAMIVDVRSGGEGRRLILQPRRKEAEHTLARRDVHREPLTNIRDSSYVQTAIAARDGGFAAYGPISLAGIGEINVRVKPLAGAYIEFRLDSPEGDLLGSVKAGSTAALQHPATTYPPVPEGIEPPSLEGWADLSTRVDLPENPGGVHTLYLVFRRDEAAGEGEEELVLVDWLDFENTAP
jgi:glucose/arabinose dehydrogenase